MKKLIVMVIAVLALTANIAQAREIDFIGRVMNLNVDAPAPTATRLVSVAAFDDSQMATLGFYTITFRVTNLYLEIPEEVFFGSATISAGQTEVQVGTLATGRIILTYDSATDRVEAKFQLNLGNRATVVYEVLCFDNFNWYGTTRVTSSIEV